TSCSRVRHSGLDPESILFYWIPGLRFASPGMTGGEVSPLIKLNASAVSGGAYVKLRQNGTVSRLIKLIASRSEAPARRKLRSKPRFF
ncbi:MAG: hypothetical protein K9K88_14400, partial [Desulfobacterales bacterium]|nr:hypothetical protein [Desulfobacterales bacterium]